MDRESTHTLIGPYSMGMSGLCTRTFRELRASLARGIFLRVFNRLNNPDTQKILESRDVPFIEIENVSSLVRAQVRRTSEQEPLSDKYHYTST